ncbi:MAG TPA: hypothetical protein VG603_09830 [Chitinophagales bacterium]|nr:hypothetical protein [Chitinophagales bacterium]
MIAELIESLTTEERNLLESRTRQNNTQLYRFISVLLENPNATKEDLTRRFKINSNTYFKNLSLAREEIYDAIKHLMKNAYDDLLLANVLYRRGLEVHASKLRLKLEEDYCRQGWWSVLQEVYNLDMLVAYAKCDIKWLEKTKAKTFKNADRIAAYLKLEKEAVVQMAIIEKGGLKENEFTRYAQKAKKLLIQARAINHPIPIFNLLHSLFTLYTAYSVDLDKAKSMVKEMEQFLKNYGSSLLPYASNAAHLNTMGFYADFWVDEVPDPLLRKVNAAVGIHGLLFDAQATLHFCRYYFLRQNTAQFEKYFAKYLALPLDKTFSYKTAYLHCLRAYLDNDIRGFNNFHNEFYSDEKSRAYNDYDLQLRYLEIMLLLKDDSLGLAANKLEATIKFVRRTFTPQRVAIEKLHWQILSPAIHKKPFTKKINKVYRFSDFMLRETVALLKTKKT